MIDTMCCTCECHDENDNERVPFCNRCDSDYSNLCSSRFEEFYCPICGEDKLLPVHDMECFK